jgi:1-acyl-sn-glycerol-3-phosphate acyltransferase
MALLRSLAFYLVFYLGSIGYSSAALLMLPVGPVALRKVVRAWSRFHRTCARVLVGITVRIEGEAPRGAAFYALKHESFFEAIDQPALLESPAVFAKEELFNVPLWGAAARAYGLVPVARDQGPRALRAMLSAAKALVAEGRPLSLFPEGTRVPHGTEPPLQSGFAGLYKLLGLPVIPVAVDSGRLYHRFVKQPGSVTYRFGEPIPAGLPRDEAEARVHAAINALNR